MEHRAECNPYLYFFSGELAFLSFSQVFPICLGKPDMLTKLLEVSSVGAAFLLPMFAGLAPPSSSVPSGSIGSFNVFKEVDIRSGIVLLLVFVDDIAFSSNDFVSINELKRTLRTQFDMKDLGDSKCFLGIEVMRSQRGLEPIASMQ